MTTATSFDRVMARAEWQGECLVFMGSRTVSGGYGQVANRPGPPLRAHRVVYAHHHGPIPDGLVIRHRCDNPPCVNIAHLEIGTHKDNIGDAVERGRHGHGTVGPHRKVTPEMLAVILSGVTGAEASRVTGISESHVSRLRRQHV